MSLPASTPIGPQNDVPNASAIPRLNSWKEIAAYFDRDIRTVQLWEKREALPIHRHEHSTRSSVYAYPAELDTWLRTRRHDRLPTPIHPEPSAPRLSARRSAIAAILILALLSIPLAAWRLHLRSQPYPLHLGPGQTLAVLPFEDLSPAGATGLWVDGFTDDLITDLGTTEHLQVISRRSVMSFKSTRDPLPDIARKLHATLILEGTVAHQDGKVRITARLIDPAHDHQLWAQSYTRETADILSLQDEVAADITSAISQQLTGSIPPPLTAAARPVDPRVRLAYLTGLYFLNQRDEPGLLKAIDSFHQAISRDSHYAPAYAGLADCYNLLAVWGKLPSAQAFPQARAAVQTALSFDPTSAQAYTSLAFETYRYEWNFAQAESLFLKAIALNPNYATAHQWFGEFLGDLRRFDQSLAELRKACDLDPLSAIAGSDLAVGYVHAGRESDAITELHRILSLYPSFAPAHNYLASAYHDIGDSQNALKQAEIFSHITGDNSGLENMRIFADARSGNLTQARAECRARLNLHNTNFFDQAKLYFAVHQPDLAYAALDRSFNDHSWWLVTLLVDPGFESVRNDPRFRLLAQRVGLPLPPTPPPKPTQRVAATILPS